MKQVAMPLNITALADQGQQIAERSRKTITSCESPGNSPVAPPQTGKRSTLHLNSYVLSSQEFDLHQSKPICTALCSPAHRNDTNQKRTVEVP